ncbi:MAG: molybdenum cofactor guanylyltransferase [Peptococcaceae bacterium]|nr:molybdenum cofactor guanylyltransferase [Peptococcaceae bacterium]
MEITGIILAGGKSTRMGCDKAFLDLGGLRLIEKVAKVLSLVCREIIISGNSQDEQLNTLGYPVIEDIHANCGPLAGIYTCLSAAKTQYSFVTACDMPFIEENIIARIIREANGFDAAVMKHRECLEPLFSLYSKNFIPAAEKSIITGNYSVTATLKQVRWKPIVFHPQEIPFFDRKIMNINNPYDYHLAKRLEIK